jgi:glycosyltransferase involved in cell wall biosynthesis
LRVAIFNNLPSGGAKRSLYEQISRLAGRCQFDLYTLSTANQEFCDIRPFVDHQRVYPFDPAAEFRSPFGRLSPILRIRDLDRLDRLYRQVAAEIDREGYDLVYVQPCIFSTAPTLMRYLRTPTVYYCHEPPRIHYEPTIGRPYLQGSSRGRVLDRFDPLPGWYRKAYLDHDRSAIENARAVLVNSAYTRETVYRIYGIFARICYLGVDTRLFRPLGLERQDYVLSVGALGPHKGFDFMVRSLGKLPGDQRPRLVIVTNDYRPLERAYLDEIAAEARVQIEYRPLVDDETLVRLYNQARLVVYTPIMEPFGFASVEAMACGTPVVGIREAGLRETVQDGLTGVLVERDEDQLAGALNQLLLSPEQVERMGAIAREQACLKWNWDRSANWLFELFQSVAVKGAEQQ